MQNVLSCAFGIFDFKNDIFGGCNLAGLGRFTPMVEMCRVIMSFWPVFRLLSHN